MNMQYSQLYQFGYTSLAPFLLDWYMGLRKTASSKGAQDIYCIGREGWKLVQVFSNISNISNEGFRFHYLKCSRSFLSHCSLNDEHVINYITSERFEGKISEFYKRRLSLENFKTNHECDELIRLPQDKEYMYESIMSLKEEISNYSKNSNLLYQQYLNKIGMLPNENMILTDIGYRGTIQWLLERGFGIKSTGVYAIYDSKNLFGEFNGERVGLFSDRYSFGSGRQLIDKSILLEMLFTSPLGQVNGIYKDELGNIRFNYNSPKSAQLHYGVISHVFEGVFGFIIDNKDLILDMMNNSESFISNVDIWFERVMFNFARLNNGFKLIGNMDDSFYGNTNLELIV